MNFRRRGGPWSSGSLAGRESRNHNTSIGAADLVDLRPAFSLTMEWRPWPRYEVGADFRRSPLGVLTLTPVMHLRAPRARHFRVHCAGENPG